MTLFSLDYRDTAVIERIVGLKVRNLITVSASTSCTQNGKSEDAAAAAAV